MDVATSNEFCMRIDDAREGALDLEQQLQATQCDIVAVMEAAEQLTVEACALGLRREELEKDEAALVQSEALAVQNKVLAEKKLMEVGGYECVVRILRKALQKAKLEIMDTEGGQAPAVQTAASFSQLTHPSVLTSDETKELIHEELVLRAQITNLAESLATTQQSVSRLQQECAVAAASKREADDKLRQLSHFLNQALGSPSNNRESPRPASPTS
ncbi:unnamed protein product [Phytophthora lilii]|uniref:Unnamed protein product n=1 Tax=Phytophthora lilii TaxID=2077276 RepID=A0A9W6X2U6_9STRA|nr:unnamed protein product [Phytophthora lilii]